MYQTLPSFILGFHGCDRKIGEAILSGSERMRLSTNEYDWLGHGYLVRAQAQAPIREALSHAAPGSRREVPTHSAVGTLTGIGS